MERRGGAARGVRVQHVQGFAEKAAPQCSSGRYRAAGRYHSMQMRSRPVAHLLLLPPAASADPSHLIPPPAVLSTCPPACSESIEYKYLVTSEFSDEVIWQPCKNLVLTVGEDVQVGG